MNLFTRSNDFASSLIITFSKFFKRTMDRNQYDILVTYHLKSLTLYTNNFWIREFINLKLKFIHQKLLENIRKY